MYTFKKLCEKLYTTREFYTLSLQQNVLCGNKTLEEYLYNSISMIENQTQHQIDELAYDISENELPNLKSNKDYISIKNNLINAHRTISRLDIYKQAKQAYLHNQKDKIEELLPQILDVEKTKVSSPILFHGVSLTLEEEVSAPEDFISANKYAAKLKRIFNEGLIGREGIHPVAHNNDFRPIYATQNPVFAHGIAGVIFDSNQPILHSYSQNPEEVSIFTSRVFPQSFFIKSYEFIEQQNFSYDGSRTQGEYLSKYQKNMVKNYIEEVENYFKKNALSFHSITDDPLNRVKLIQ